MDSILQNMDPEKRDKIINAAINEFSSYPYEKASTNNIVKAAGISKGLLFHYFGSKKDLYEKLLGYVLNKLFKEISSQIAWDESDIFGRIKALVIVKMKIGQIYPNMFDFIIRVLSDNNANSVEDIQRIYETYGIDMQAFLGDIYTRNIDYSLFRDPGTVDKCIDIIRWTLEKFAVECMQKMGKMDCLDIDKINSELDTYINILKKTFYH